MNRLALGTAQFGSHYGIANRAGQVTRPEVGAMLHLARANGIDTLDTAIAYGDSEICLGEVGTEGFKVVTKLPALPDNCVDVQAWVGEQVSASLSRLGVTDVYGLLLHRSDQLLGPTGATLYHALQTLKENDQVEKIGVSIYAPIELEALTSRYRFDMVQAPFNLVDRRMQTTGWIQRLKNEDIEIHTRSAFLQGLLLMAESDIPDKFLSWSGLWQTWHRWLGDHDGSALETCLAFPLSFPEIDRVIVGADSVRQLEQIMSAADSQSIHDLPDLKCDIEKLINPAKWSSL